MFIDSSEILCLMISLCCSFIISCSEANLNRKRKDSKIVFLITKDPDNYEADITIPKFVKQLTNKYEYQVNVLLGGGERTKYSFSDTDVIKKADLLIVFSRRIALPQEQMMAIKNHIARGKPLIGIRTANHAFTLFEKELPYEGFESWKDFVPDILGCENRGYGPVGPGINVSVVMENSQHPILQGFKNPKWNSNGNIYLVAPLLDTNAKVLLIGESADHVEPIAWTRKEDKSKIFYTSLGHPDDFESYEFKTLLTNAINWALGNN